MKGGDGISGSSSILVTTFGMSWPIVPELLAFTNPDDVPLLENSAYIQAIRKMRKDFEIHPVDEVWIITTEGTKDRSKLIDWFRGLSADKISWRIFIAKNIEDLSTATECEYMADLIYRVVFRAQSDGGKKGKIYLSLAGGRKTMSADMQQAAHIFGCDALLHIAAPPRPQSPLDGKDVLALYKPLPPEIAEDISPIIISGKTEPASFLSVKPIMDSFSYPLSIPDKREESLIESQTNLVREIRKRQQNARNLLYSFRSDLINNSLFQNFLSLYTLHPRHIIKLKEAKIGLDIQQREEELNWLRKLPKAELHCHLGGILHPEDHVEVARVMRSEVDSVRKTNRKFDKWLIEIGNYIHRESLSELRDKVQNLRSIRSLFGVKEPLAVCGFLMQFDGYENLLHEFIYAGINSCSGFQGIGIERYEKLGDLQGSGLLQAESTIRQTLRVLKRQCKEDNIKYLELRCSPCNYTRSGLSAKQVVTIILEELENDFNTQFRLIFIASRHREIEVLKQHLTLYHVMKGDERFQKMFAGFDLAGNESAGSPADLRDYFLEVMEDSVNMTIHAGEDRPAQSIWEAVYHLNADRIGHGLTLQDDEALLSRFLNRRIAIEMCPSSNYQIVGYRDFNIENSKDQEYPLKEYFERGLPVTINTDDPGISLTSLSREYHKAASMTCGGISRWDILQIIKNGFEFSFLEYNEKIKLLSEIDGRLYNIIT